MSEEIEVFKNATKGYIDGLVGDLADKVFDEVESVEDILSEDIYLDGMIKWIGEREDRDDMLAMYEKILKYYGYSVFPPSTKNS